MGQRNHVYDHGIQNDISRMTLRPVQEFPLKLLYSMEEINTQKI